jgi:hypothetical protein
MSFFGSDYTLLDLLKESAWTAPTWRTIRQEIVDPTEEMSIIPETEHGPMLEITSKDKDGTVVHRRRMNLAAVDDEIGKLIKMRDHMAAMKGSGE